MRSSSHGWFSPNVRKYAKAKEANLASLADLSERNNSRDQLPFKKYLKGYARANEQSAIRLKIVRNP